MCFVRQIEQRRTTVTTQRLNRYIHSLSLRRMFTVCYDFSIIPEKLPLESNTNAVIDIVPINKSLKNILVCRRYAVRPMRRASSPRSNAPNNSKLLKLQLEQVSSYRANAIQVIIDKRSNHIFDLYACVCARAVKHPLVWLMTFMSFAYRRKHSNSTKDNKRKENPFRFLFAISIQSIRNLNI